MTNSNDPSGMAAHMDAEAIARHFHDTYERLAPKFGYETRPDTKAFDPESANGRLMIAVCSEIAATWNTRPTPDAGRLVEHLVSIADACRRADGSDIPLGQQVRQAAATITAQAAEIARLRGLLAEVAAQPTITEMARGPDKPRIMMTIKERLDGMVRNKERHDAIIRKARVLTGETP